MKNKHWITAYVAVSILTYGYAAEWRREVNQNQTCLLNNRPEIKVSCTDQLPAPVAGIFGAVLWPLYWSWASWEDFI